MKSNSWVSLIAATGFALGIPSCGGSNAQLQTFAKSKALHGTVELGQVSLVTYRDGCRCYSGSSAEIPTEVVQLYLEGNLTQKSISAAEDKLGHRLAMKSQNGHGHGCYSIHTDYDYCSDKLDFLLRSLSSNNNTTLKTLVANAKPQPAASVSR